MNNKFKLITFDQLRRTCRDSTWVVRERLNRCDSIGLECVIENCPHWEKLPNGDEWDINIRTLNQYLHLKQNKGE